MYPGILMATSNLHKSHPYQQNQMNNMNTTVPSGFPPIQLRYCENHYEEFHGHGQPQSPINHAAYQEHVSYPMHQSPSQGFDFQQGRVTNDAPFYHPGLNYEYSVQEQVRMTNYSITRRAQPRQVERNVLVVELEHPVFPMSKPRLRWTQELHERFTRAAQELGGYFKATPKAILQKMNVRGVTRDQLKSHLQKVRNRVLHTSSVNEILNGQAYGMPNYESNSTGHERMHISCESHNQHHTHRIAPTDEDLDASNFKHEFKEDYSGTTFSQSSSSHRSLRNVMCDDHADDMKLIYSDFE